MKTWKAIIRGKEADVVNSQWYNAELAIIARKAAVQFDGAIDINPCVSNFFFDKEGLSSLPIQIGINWGAIGTVTPATAEDYAELIKEAAKLADGFKYNGYYEKWIAWDDLSRAEQKEICDYMAEAEAEFAVVNV